MEQSYTKRTITFILPSHLGDRFLNRNECEFIQGKSPNGEMMVVEEKIKTQTNEKRDKAN